MKIERAHQLFARVFGMTKPVLRQRKARRRSRARIGVADQGKNRVIERRRGNLYRTFLGGLGIGGQNLGQQFPFALDHKTLIVERVVALFLDQRGNVFVFQKEFVEPCNLRKHLQVGEMLRLKILFGLLGHIAVLAEPLPQFPVARVTSNHVCRIRLKEILKGEVPISGSR